MSVETRSQSAKNNIHKWIYRVLISIVVGLLLYMLVTQSPDGSEAGTIEVAPEVAAARQIAANLQKMG